MVQAKARTDKHMVATHLPALLARQSTDALLVDGPDPWPSTLTWPHKRLAHLPLMAAIDLPASTLHRVIR